MSAQSVGRTQVKMSEIETGSETPLETNSVDKIKLEHHHLKAFDRFYCLEHAFILLYIHNLGNIHERLWRGEYKSGNKALHWCRNLEIRSFLWQFPHLQLHFLVLVPCTLPPFIPHLRTKYALHYSNSDKIYSQYYFVCSSIKLCT